MKFHSYVYFYLLASFTLFFAECNKGSSPSSSTGTTPLPPVITATNQVDYYLTTASQSSLLTKQSAVLSFNTSSNSYPTIEVDSTKTYQTIDGFGYTLTSGSAYVIENMNVAPRNLLLRELFSGDSNAIDINYLRISVGASDMNDKVFSYDDMPSNQTDPTLSNFSLSSDTLYFIPLLKEVLAINPTIKIVATPWSAPSWTKDNNSSIGGSLLPAYYSTYANYFVKYLQQMKARGITIDAITPQNEPLNPNNNPSMNMTALQEADFIKNYLAPAFTTAGISTKIIVYDHNCDHPEYATTILSDPDANKYVNGSAFHLYAGDITALSRVHNSYPDKDIYFTEQYTASTGTFNGDLQWHIKNVIIGAMNNWSRNALEWNLATDASFGPHTSGGCTTCQGAITVSGSTFYRNVSYYIIAHASKFVTPNSLRIASTANTNNLYSTAFLRPDGKKVLIVLNNGSTDASFNLKTNVRWVTPLLPANSVGTFVW